MRLKAGARTNLFLCLLVLNSGLAVAGDPPQERDPNQDEGTLGEGVFDSGSFGLELVWKKPLGSGHSRITVVDGRAITMFSDGEFDNLVVLDAATGEELWRYRIATTYRGHDGSQDGPQATPAVDEGVVYGLGPKGHLFAVSFADGKEIWSKKIDEELGASVPFWGFATTPVVEDQVLIVQTGGPDGRSITGFNKKTGEFLWSVGDDRVGYQSPAVLTLAGQRQVIAVSNRELMGILPQTGEVLWRHQHSTTELDGSSQPVAIGEDRFLLTSSATEYWSNTGLYRVSRDDRGFAVEEIWSSNALKFSYAVPVLYENRLYGFQRGFLTCVDPATGKAIWKSRPPGGNNLTLVDDLLVIFATEGFVVLAAADAGGYGEVARLQVFDRGAFTAPVFADGMIFVRNHEHIAAVRMGAVGERGPVTQEEPGVEELDPAWRTNAVAALLRRLEVAENKERLVDEFLESQRQFPIVEADRLVHFVYRGPATDVAIRGGMTDLDKPDPMRRMPGTDLFYRSYTFEPGSRWEYVLQVDLERWIPDPLNPRRAPSGRRPISELVMQGWMEPEHLREPTGEHGTIEGFELASDILGNRREVKVYLPPGYSGHEDLYPLLVVVDGPRVLEYGLMDRSLDNLVHRTVAPMIVAFVGPPKARYESFSEVGGPQEYKEYGGPRTDEHAQMVARELVPEIERRYRIDTRPASRAVMGHGSPGLGALYAAVHHPDVFGKVAVQSLRFGPTQLQSSRLRHRPVFDAIIARLESEERLPLEFYLDWASHDLRSAELGIDLREDGRQLAGLLREKGYSVVGLEYAGGAGWGSWRARTDKILEAFFPLRPRN